MNPKTALRSAAAESLARVRLDHRKAPDRLRPLLAVVRDHLFDARLDVNWMKKRAGVRDNSIPIHFHAVFGRSPRCYIEDRRLETGCHLLAWSDLRIWQVAELLGYSGIQVFSRAFRRWAGERPTSYRKRERRRRPSSAAAGPERFSPAKLRAGLLGELDQVEACSVVDRLRDLYPELETAEG